VSTGGTTDEPTPRRPDRGRAIEAIAWISFGLVLLVAAWRMPRLEAQHIAPWSAPGLLPGVVGALMALAGIVLFFTRDEAAAPAADAAADADVARGAPDARTAPTDPPVGAGRDGGSAIVVALVLCVGYAAAGVGHGIPFAIASALFIVAFVAWFRWPVWRVAGGRGVVRGLAAASAIGIGVAFAFAWLFESVFLVRLP
jgi:hypothetical protein